MRFTTTSVRRAFIAIITASLLLLGVRPLIFPAGAAELPNRSIKISSAQAGSTAEYTVSFDIASAATLGSISILFCDNSALEAIPCNAPPGFDASGTSLLSQTGETGFTIDPSSTANNIILTRTAAAATPGPVSYRFDNIVNPSASGSYFGKIATYATEDATGSSTDFGGIALINNNSVGISTTVPPYLLFCMGVTITGTDCNTASGDYVNFGELSKTSARTGTTQMLVATNAGSGYVIVLSGTTMLSGTNAIPALTANDVSRPGTSQFGINLRANTDPVVGQNPAGSGTGSPNANYNIPNRYRFVPGEQVASSASSDRYRKYTVSYIINIASDQAPGIYVSTITYVTTATF